MGPARQGGPWVGRGDWGPSEYSYSYLCQGMPRRIVRSTTTPRAVLSFQPEGLARARAGDGLGNFQAPGGQAYLFQACLRGEYLILPYPYVGTTVLWDPE